MCDVIIWSQESVHEDEIEKKEVGKDKTDRNKVRVCLRYGEKRQGLHNGASPEKSKIQWIIHQDCQQPLQPRLFLQISLRLSQVQQPSQ